MNKVKIWSWEHASGIRMWYFKCRACATWYKEDYSKYCGGPQAKWKYVLDDALTHIGIYH